MASTSKSHKKPIVQKLKSTSSSSYKNVNHEGEINWKNDANVKSIVYKPRSPTSKVYQQTRDPESEINWDSNDNGETYYGGKKSRKSHNSKKSKKSKKSHTYKRSKRSTR